MRCGCEWHASLRSHEEHASGASVEAADPAVAAVSALRGYKEVYLYPPGALSTPGVVKVPGTGQ